MTLFENNRPLLAIMGTLLLVSCSYLPDQLDPIDWVDSANDWVKAGIWGNQSSDSDPNTPMAGEAALSTSVEEDPFPSLAKVPDERPSTSSFEERELLAEQLIADRDNVRYSEEPSVAPARVERAVEVPVVPDTPEATDKITSPISSQEIVAPPPSTVQRQAPKSDSRHAGDTVEMKSPENVTNYSSSNLRKNIPIADEFAITPPPVPEVPNWSTVEEHFYSMFRASGGAGSTAQTAVVAGDHRMTNSSIISNDGIAVAAFPFSTHAAVIYFDHGSARLSRQDREVLRQVAAAQKEYGGNVRVVGHASSKTKTNDLVDHKLANYQTSLTRARAVADELVKLGVESQRIFVEAVSDNQPDYSEATKLGEAANRRANIYIEFLTPPS